MKPLRYLLALVIPPVGVYLTYGFGQTLIINILLTFLGWLPGSIHAIWAISKREENFDRPTI